MEQTSDTLQADTGGELMELEVSMTGTGALETGDIEADKFGGLLNEIVRASGPVKTFLHDCDTAGVDPTPAILLLAANIYAHATRLGGANTIAEISAFVSMLTGLVISETAKDPNASKELGKINFVFPRFEEE